MQSTITTAAPAAAKPAKPAKAAKPVAAKPVNLAKPSDATADTASTTRADERIAAAAAVRDFYTGKSLPFKAASDTFATLRLDKPAKAATTRQAALIAAMLLSGDNVKRNGHFTRGGFIHDGKAVQPETGCLSDMLGRVVKHVSGPLTGKQARDAVFSIDLKLARAEISAHLGDKLGKLALARIDKLAA